MVDNKTYFCDVMSGNPFQPLGLKSSQLQTVDYRVEDRIFFYVMTDVAFKNNQSINVKIAPYTASGKTQNLGRREIRFTANLLLVNEQLGLTAQQKINKLFEAKAKGKILKVQVPGLPTGTNNYYIEDINWTIKEPNRIIASVAFVEVLESSLQIMTQNLVLSNSLKNIQTLLKQLGLAG